MVSGQTVLHAAVARWGMAGGVLYEGRRPLHDRFEATAAEGVAGGVPTATFAARGLLSRWLRVNQRGLAIPDTIGVLEGAPPDEQRELHRLGATLAVPLVHQDVLIGWIALIGPQPPDVVDSTSSLPPEVQRWADELQGERDASEAAARAETLAQSNRLSLAGRIAAGIAHEVRNPLATVRSIVQLVQSDDAPAEDRQRLMGNVLAQIDRVNGVLTGMLTLGRPSQARIETIDLADVVTDALSVCSAYARSHGQVIQRGLSTRIAVAGDPHELRQVFVNVLLNACQASKPGGTIHVDLGVDVASDGALHAVVSVRDSGSGVPASIIERVFEPFFTTKADGGGLGLALCRDAMYRHNGDILLSSEVGVGTIVTIRLPAQGTDVQNPGR
jgi:signal transduction histidine kinase